MKYIAIFDDEMIENFRTDDYGQTLVMNDQRGYTRAVKLVPLAKPLLTNEKGKSFFLTQGHIEVLLDYEREKSIKRMIDSFVFDDAEYINTDWLTDDSFIGFASEKVERDKQQKDNEVNNG